MAGNLCGVDSGYANRVYAGCETGDTLSGLVDYLAGHDYTWLPLVGLEFDSYPPISEAQVTTIGDAASPSYFPLEPGAVPTTDSLFPGDNAAEVAARVNHPDFSILALFSYFELLTGTPLAIRDVEVEVVYETGEPPWILLDARVAQR